MTMLITMCPIPMSVPRAEWWHAWMHECMKGIRRVFGIVSVQQDVSELENKVRSVAEGASTPAPSLDPEEMQRFKEVMLLLLDSAYSLARYLLRDKEGAEDVVQDAYLRALRAFTQYRGGDAKSWLMAVVRNCCMTRIANTMRNDERVTNSDKAIEDIAWSSDTGHVTPEQEYDVQQRSTLIRDLIGALPEPLREALILREIEELSYAQIAGIMQIPVGTVMSRLARARTQLSAACQQRGLVMS